MSFALLIVGAVNIIVAGYNVLAQNNHSVGTWHLVLGFFLFYLADQNKD